MFELVYKNFTNDQDFLPLLMARLNILPLYALGISTVDYADINGKINHSMHGLPDCSLAK